jgi:FkbM family methyltransferase
MHMKRQIQALLNRAGLYYRLKSSKLYDWYWTVAQPAVLRERDQEVKFYREALPGLGKGILVFDIGANMGHKCDVFLRLGCRVVAVDPDPSNVETLRQRFFSWRFRRKPVEVVPAAVSNHTGTETLWVDEPGSAKNTLNPKWVETLRADESRFGNVLKFGDRVEVPTTTLEELINQHGRPFYIKIDVEGHEVKVLEGLRSPVEFVSFEVNLPEFLPESIRCVSLLEAIAPGGEFNYSAGCGSGLALARWHDPASFLPLLQAAKDPSLEVFWRAPISHKNEDRVTESV